MEAVDTDSEERGICLFDPYARFFFSLHRSLLAAENLEDLLNTLGEELKGVVEIAGINLVFRDEALSKKQIHRCFSDVPPPAEACQYVSQLATDVFDTKVPLELDRETLGGIMESGIVYPLFFHNQVEAALGFFCTEPLEELRVKLEGIGDILPEIGLIVGGYRLWWERELRRRQWETAMEAVDDAIFVADLNNMKVSYSNRAAKELLGEGLRENSNLSMHSCKIPLLCSLCQNMKESVARSKTPKDSRFVSKDRTFSLRAFPIIGDGGDVDSVLFILRDVSSEVRTNLNLIRAERLEAISEVLEGVSHSLNNPLTAVVGFAQFLLERSDIPEDAKKMLGVIEREGKRSSEVVNRLLSFVGTREGVEGQVDLCELVNNIALLRRQAMFERGVELELMLDPEVPFIWGESHALQQALVNIVLNAEKVVKDKEGMVRISVRQRDEEVEVTIEDNGPGIPKEIRDSIFYPFFTTDVTKGTGLGLSIALSSVEEHGGRIEVGDSELGGALFRVFLPLPSVSRH